VGRSAPSAVAGAVGGQRGDVVQDVRQRLVALGLRRVLGALLVLRRGQDGDVLHADVHEADQRLGVYLRRQADAGLVQRALDQRELRAHVAERGRVAERLGRVVAAVRRGARVVAGGEGLGGRHTGEAGDGGGYSRGCPQLLHVGSLSKGGLRG